MSLTINNYDLSTYYPSMIDYTKENLTNGLYVLYESEKQIFIDYFILEKKSSPNFRNPDMSFSLYTIQNTGHYDLDSVKHMVNKYSKWIATTMEAKNIIKTYGNNIYNYHESVTHDGYDLQGPVSDLWDLLIFYNKDGNVMVDSYHRENWFNGHNDVYDLISTQSGNHLSSYIKQNVPSFVLMTMLMK